MALPITIGDANDNLVRGHNPPHKAANGKYYVVVHDDGGGGTQGIGVYLASDPSSSWSSDSLLLDTSISTMRCISSVIDGNTIHIVAGYTSTTGADSTRYKYSPFNCSTGNFGSSQYIETDINIGTGYAANFVNCSIAVRSDGDVIVAYVGANEANMGDDKLRVDYARREGGSWTSGIALDAGGDVHYWDMNAVMSDAGNNDCHIYWNYTTDTSNDPPNVSANSIYGRTLDASNNLSTATTAGNNNNTQTAMDGIRNMVHYTDGSTERIIAPAVNRISNGTTNHQYVTAVEDASGDVSSMSMVKDVPSTKPYSTTHNSPLAIAVDGTDLYIVFSGGGTNGADQDIYYSKSTNNGTTWDTATEHRDAVTCNFISANIYDRWGTVIGLSYLDGTTVKYDEIRFSSFFRQYRFTRPSTLLRM